MSRPKQTTTSDKAPPDRVTQYAKDVVAGRIVAGPHVRNACKRHLHDLKHAKERGLYFDRETARWAIRFYESQLYLSEGQFEGQPFLLEDSQAFKVGSLFGWLREDGRRRFRRAYIEEGKGNGKSPLAAGLGLLGMMADGEAGAQIYSAAAKREQAAILFMDAVAMCRKSPSIAKRVRIDGAQGKEHNIAYLRAASFFRPVSRDHGKTGSGPRPYFVLADEVHEMPNRDVLETLERGFKFRREPLLVMITNSGTDRNSVAWEEHEHAVRVAAGTMEPGKDFDFVGEPIDDETFSYVCALDPGDDPLENPECWVKANPLLGVTIEHDYLAGVVKQAKQMPGKMNGILRLHFCVWTDADVAWMTRKLVEPALADFDPPAEHGGKKVWVGLDLSRSRDITALAAVVKTGTMQVEVVGETGERAKVEKDTYDAWVVAWTPGDTMSEREKADRMPYSLWAQEGHIHAPAGASIPYVQVAQGLAEIDHGMQIQAVAYDRYAFAKFEEDAALIGLACPYVEHPQGGVKKGAPTEAMVQAAKKSKPPRKAEGLWMPGSVKLLEDALLEGRLRLRRNPVLISALLSAVAEEDKWGNRWLSKLRSANKIDAAVALAMAIGAADAVRVSGGGIEGWLNAKRRDAS